MKEWYIVNTYSGLEEKVKRNLEQRIVNTNTQDKIFRIIIPSEDELELRGGKKKTVTRKNSQVGYHSHALAI